MLYDEFCAYTGYKGSRDEYNNEIDPLYLQSDFDNKEQFCAWWLTQQPSDTPRTFRTSSKWAVNQAGDTLLRMGWPFTFRIKSGRDTEYLLNLK